MNDHRLTDILILGVGIGGEATFEAMKKELKRRGINKKITLIDQHNYFTFVPMLHEVASGSVRPDQCAIPIRESLYKTPHEFVKATVKRIDPSTHTVETSVGTFSYEYCVISLGSSVNYFNTPGAKEYSYHVRSLTSAIRLHKRFVEMLEDETKQDIHLTIIGGGATGVEVAGQFAHLANHDVKTLYPNKNVTITLVQNEKEILSFLHEKMRKDVTKELLAQQVMILTNTTATGMTTTSVTIKNTTETILQSDLTIWTAGFSYRGVDYLPESYCERGQIPVNEFLQLPDAMTTYAIGDIAMAKDEKGIPHPKLAQWATAHGKYAAKHIANDLTKKSSKPFEYNDKGTLIPIGDWYASAKIGPFMFHGKFAWWLRRTVYIMSVPGISRKIRIILDWTLHSFGFRHIVDLDLDVDVCTPEKE